MSYGRINLVHRTPLLPKQMRYQAALCPDHLRTRYYSRVPQSSNISCYFIFCRVFKTGADDQKHRLVLKRMLLKLLF